MVDMFFVNSIYTMYANEVRKGRAVNTLDCKMMAS